MTARSFMDCPARAVPGSRARRRQPEYGKILNFDKMAAVFCKNRIVQDGAVMHKCAKSRLVSESECTCSHAQRRRAADAVQRVHGVAQSRESCREVSLQRFDGPVCSRMPAHGRFLM